jgi:hypothetical protein
MTLQTPNLDDRKFQDIVSEARSKIPLYCPKWTDYNLSAPLPGQQSAPEELYQIHGAHRNSFKIVSAG